MLRACLLTCFRPRKRNNYKLYFNCPKVFRVQGEFVANEIHPKRVSSARNNKTKSEQNLKSPDPYTYTESEG